MRTGGGRTKSGGSLRGDHKGKEGTSQRKRPSRLRSGSRAGAPLTAAPARHRKRKEVFVPLQRHMFCEERIFLPCPQGPR